MSGSSRQLPFEFGHAPGYSRDELVLTEANRQAAALVDGWPAWPSNVVVLAGPAGSGKTHLASVWRGRASAMALPAHAIAAHVDEAAASGAAVIDDADGGGLDETGLFHLMNTLRAANGWLMLTARRFPAAWGVALPDLASRLRLAATVELHEPDDLLLAAVITKLFADRQVEVEPHVVQYLVRRIERSLSTAIRVVDRLDRAAMEGKARITRALAAEAVQAIDAGQGQGRL